jgi:HNH endonuclease
MRLYIAVTDNDWFRYLRSLPFVDEVNFWQPGGRLSFRRLRPGELLLFKLHHPENYIVGGGLFAGFVFLPYTFAWETFGDHNGAPTLEVMKRRIGRYRHGPIGPNDRIGCILLQQPFFWDEPLWIPAPADFAKNIVQGKGYEPDTATARYLWDVVNARLPARAGLLAETIQEEAPPMFGDPRLAPVRLGQGTFRALITNNYQWRCAVTGEKAHPVLDAAHIRPVTEGGLHRLDNGLLLRTDVHRLFDKGYVTVTPDGRFLVSRRIKDDFDNGEPYLPFHGQRIWTPRDPGNQPSREVLEWHAGTVFLR